MPHCRELRSRELELRARNLCSVSHSLARSYFIPEAPKGPSFLPSIAFVTFLFVEHFRINFNREVEALTCSGNSHPFVIRPSVGPFSRGVQCASSNVRPSLSPGLRWPHPPAPCPPLPRERPPLPSDLAFVPPASPRFTSQRFHFLVSSRARSHTLHCIILYGSRFLVCLSALPTLFFLSV